MRLRIVIGLFEDQDSAIVGADGEVAEPEAIKEVGFIAHIREEDVTELTVAAQKPREMIADMLVLCAKESVMKSVNTVFRSRKLAGLLARASEAVRSIGRTAAVQHQDLPTESLVAMAKQAESDVGLIIKVLEGEDTENDFEGLDWSTEQQPKGELIH